MTPAPSPSELASTWSNSITWTPDRTRFAAILRATVLENPWIPHQPTTKQALFLTCEALEVLFGGAAGGGKSDALLMAALQYINVPGYSALLLRRTYSDLSLPGALMDRSHQWLRGTGAKWIDKEKPGDSHREPH